MRNVYRQEAFITGELKEGKHIWSVACACCSRGKSPGCRDAPRRAGGGGTFLQTWEGLEFGLGLYFEDHGEPLEPWFRAGLGNPLPPKDI